MIIKMITRYPGIVHSAFLGFYHDYNCVTKFLSGERSLDAPLRHINRYELTITVESHTLDVMDTKLMQGLKRARQDLYTVVESFDVVEQSGGVE